ACTPWIYRIARGMAALALRRNGRASPAAELPELATGSQTEPEFSPEDAARIHSALDELPADQREVLVLRFLEELSYEEIGVVVGCPLGTVRSRIHYAKAALQKLLEK